MIKVLFNDREEFEAEIIRQKPVDKIIRITLITKGDPVIGFLRGVFVVAGVARERLAPGTEIVELRRYCGQDTDHGPHPALELAEKELAALQSFAEAIGLESRAGMYLDGSEQK